MVATFTEGEMKGQKITLYSETSRWRAEKETGIPDPE